MQNSQSLKSLKNSTTSQHDLGPICPVCEVGLGKPWGSDAGLAIFDCSSCNSKFFERPITDINDYREYYPYLRDFDHARAIAELDIRYRQASSKILAIKKLTQRNPIRLLDVGSGPGYFVKHACDAGIDAVAGEINADAVNFGEKHFDIRFANIMRCEPESFDVITMFHVLEHIEYPTSFIKMCLTALKRGGLVYIHVPVADPLQMRAQMTIKMLLRKRTERRGTLYAPDHVTGFSPEGIKRLLEHAGMEVQSISKVGILSAEFDPLFWRFRAHDVNQWPIMGIEIVRGGIDWINGGSWLRVLATKI